MIARIKLEKRNKKVICVFRDLTIIPLKESLEIKLCNDLMIVIYVEVYRNAIYVDDASGHCVFVTGRQYYIKNIVEDLNNCFNNKPLTNI